MKGSGVSRLMTWDGGIIMRKEKISPRNKRIGAKSNTRNIMKKNIKRTLECPNCYLGKSTLELVDMRAEIQSCT